MREEILTNNPAEKVIQFSRELFLIPLSPPIPGFQDFIGTWLYKGKETFLVDVGPTVTIPELVKSLHALDVHHLDYILLTHIHLDHAGGIGHFANHYPDAPIICHNAGIPHLADPTRLYEGSIKTLGDVARAYGEIIPVPLDRLLDAEQFSSKYVRPIITLGHSPHHVSYQTKECMFAGETGGVRIVTASGRTYLRPGTPPQFFLETALDSMDRLISENPAAMCYGHFGMTDRGKEMLKLHREQLLFWNDTIGKQMAHADGDDFVVKCIDELLKNDPHLAGFSEMERDIQERERTFLANSVKGFAGHLKRTQEKR